jgi:hypothetical protein
MNYKVKCYQGFKIEEQIKNEYLYINSQTTLFVLLLKRDGFKCVTI